MDLINLFRITRDLISTSVPQTKINNLPTQMTPTSGIFLTFILIVICKGFFAIFDLETS